ncbi:hypothetical protein CC1G_07581 [Coprinopsis cinerea okayama7|uniref:Uncharacterized protein n=1 Tax=Coprinopsis cinerea (strain Okayama-7 / 130 / ATCC MYA-4618 / FGSC 9003) TaxID=240176 RepID=A8NUN9_COPC7|nr:hypothetical protein CC1G_07581 [Coprinopsis cinerea okayama7\|eukprot:XP_001836498.1 hypothetical protein CC1G_07581 [Coprinopsis cinerea okayama7\
MSSFFARFALLFVGLFALQTAFASPINQAPSRRSDITPVSFNLWGGFQSFNGFDDFFGVDNIFGLRNEQLIIEVLDVNNRAACRAPGRGVRQIQQQLAIVQELTKRIILEQACEVELQLLLLEQLRGGFSIFGEDIRRRRGRAPGFDLEVAQLILQLLDGDGKFRDIDFGFGGLDIGLHTVIPLGSNWDDHRSPGSILQLDDLIKIALSTGLRL